MTVNDAGTVLITGPTGGLGKATTLEMARRTGSGRPDLLLAGRRSKNLTAVAAEARAAGAKAYEIPCDLSRLSDVRAAAVRVRDLLATGVVRPLRGLVANAGVSPKDDRSASAEGYELTFAVNHLAHAQLIGDLLGSFTAPARIVLLGSNTYKASRAKQMQGVRPAEWRDPVDLARPAPADSPGGVRAAAVAYATSKLAVLYYAHELQRRVGDGIGVAVFNPGFMPGTGLAREHNRAVRATMRVLKHVPGWRARPALGLRSPRSCSTSVGRTFATAPMWTLTRKPSRRPSRTTAIGNGGCGRPLPSCWKRPHPRASENPGSFRTRACAEIRPGLCLPVHDFNYGTSDTPAAVPPKQGQPERTDRSHGFTPATSTTSLGLEGPHCSIPKLFCSRSARIFSPGSL
jgi:NAD(P)-dependent dehydrogenase (short-subunit alcohol dehydrogenase family)